MFRSITAPQLCMNHQEFSDAVRTLREEEIEVEELFGVDSLTIAQWESGERRIPQIRVRQVSWFLREIENGRLLRAANLPTCEWNSDAHVRYQSQVAESSGTAIQDATINFARELEAHTSTCEVCRSNEQWKKRNLEANGRFPLPGLSGRFITILSFVPAPLVPAAIGAALLGGLVGIPSLFAVVLLLIRFPGIPEALSTIGEAALAVGAAALGGASGGLAFPIVRPVFRRLGTIGDYLTGIAVVEAYIFALALISDTAFGEPMLENPGDWKLMAGLAAVFGLVGTFAVRRNDK